MDSREATQHLAAIRRIMESATQLTVLPGWAAVIGGVAALVGCGATYPPLGGLDLADAAKLSVGGRAGLVAVWAAVGVFGVVLDVALTVRLARKRGRNPWSRLAQLTAYAMAPCLAVALALTLGLIGRGEWGMIPAVWIMLYGAAVWMASVMSIRAPGWLGLYFIAAGVVTLFWAQPIALVMIGLTYGLGHVVFGVYLLRKYGA